LQGDVKATLQALLPLLTYHEDRSFLQKAQHRMEKWNKLRADIESDHTTPIHPAYLVSLVSRLAEENALIAIDTGAHTLFTARHFQIRPSQQIIACGTLASMGPGLPYGIAAQLAWPDRQCLVMAGDGSLTMLMGELATAVLYNLPVKVIVFKNNQLAMDRFEQEEIGSKEYGISLHPIDFAKIAEACGAEGYTCKEPGELEIILQKAFTSDQPAVIQIEVDPDAAPDPPEKIK
jgi:pyruvate dehydrogenase (quinone)